jgi:hypothetical protein
MISFGSRVEADGIVGTVSSTFESPITASEETPLIMDTKRLVYEKGRGLKEERSAARGGGREGIVVCINPVPEC